MTKYLERMGQEVITQYDPGWGEPDDCDVVLLLRGKYPYPAEENHEGALRVMWNISHPEAVTVDEYRSHDLVLVASVPWAERLRAEYGIPAKVFLQCTDLEEFYPRHDAERRGFVFIGNTRDAERPAVLWAIEYGLPLNVWGRGWSQWIPDNYMVSDYIANEQLGELYSSARVTLNDHWPDMREYGYINNRILDALACGLPVISDWHSELEKHFPNGVLLYRDQAEFDHCVQSVLLEYPRVLEEVSLGQQTVRERFSFEDRARELVEVVGSAVSARS